MKNVVVVALGGTRYAIELRWVRDVFTIGYVTPVPWAPPTILGVTNFRGSILSVLDATSLLSTESTAPRRPGSEGDVAVILEIDELKAALRVDSVKQVSTLREGDHADMLVDSRGQNVPLLNPPTLLDSAMATTLAAVKARKDRSRGR